MGNKFCVNCKYHDRASRLQRSSNTTAVQSICTRWAVVKHSRLDIVSGETHAWEEEKTELCDNQREDYVSFPERQGFGGQTPKDTRPKRCGVAGYFFEHEAQAAEQVD
jgi:hypothetical protein